MNSNCQCKHSGHLNKTTWDTNSMHEHIQVWFSCGRLGHTKSPLGTYLEKLIRENHPQKGAVNSIIIKIENVTSTHLDV